MPKRTREQLLEALDEQIQFLTRSAEDFDEGHLIEAKRMAVSLRVLFHNTTHSHALLNQLMLHQVLTWIDSAGSHDPANLIKGSTLTHMRMSSAGDGTANVEYMAGLGDRPPGNIYVHGKWIPRNTRLKFADWWAERVILDNEENFFTRSGLVLALANQEGGAHVDQKVKVAYDRLANSNSLGWTVSDANGERDLDSNPVYPSVRQITWEVLESLKQQQHLLK